MTVEAGLTLPVRLHGRTSLREPVIVDRGNAPREFGVRVITGKLGLRNTPASTASKYREAICALLTFSSIRFLPAVLRLGPTADA